MIPASYDLLIQRRTVFDGTSAQADIVLLDPTALKRAKLDCYAEAPFEAMGGLQRVVNRNGGVVGCTLIRGQVAFENDTPSPQLGKQATGRFLASIPRY